MTEGGPLPHGSTLVPTRWQPTGAHPQHIADLANTLLTTAVETWGWSWTSKGASASYGLVRRPVVDAPGPAKPPKSRKLMRSATRPAGGLQRVYSNATGENDSDKLPPNGDLPQRPRTTSPRGVRIEEVRSGPVPPLPSGRLPGPALSAGRYQRARAPRTTRPGSRRRGRDRDGKE